MYMYMALYMYSTNCTCTCEIHVQVYDIYMYMYLYMPWLGTGPPVLVWSCPSSCGCPRPRWPLLTILGRIGTTALACAGRSPHCQVISTADALLVCGNVQYNLTPLSAVRNVSSSLHRDTTEFSSLVGTSSRHFVRLNSNTLVTYLSKNLCRCSMDF